MALQPVILEGKIARLEPLALSHAVDLAIFGNNPDIWRYMRYGQVDTEDKMIGLVNSLLKLQAQGTDLPFAVIYRETGRAVGMTRFMDIQPDNLGLEIGGTWYGVSYQHTGLNTECKYLLLQYAFEQLSYIRVQIKTDLRNERSQRAIERIGGIKEGVLRDQVIMLDGYKRSSVYYSILTREWPEVKQRLLNLMNR